MESERQPLLPRSAEGPWAALGRGLLWLSGWRFFFIVLALFFVHLVRHDQVVEWLSLANSTLKTDVFFSLGGVLAVLATALFAFAACAEEDAGIEIHCCFPLVFLAAATTLWSALLRISEAHGLEISCAFHGASNYTKFCTDRRMFSGILELWAFLPRGLLLAARRALLRPWAWGLGLEPDHHDPYEAWQWREVLVSCTFWFSVLLSLMLAPAVQAGLSGGRLLGCWLAFWFGLLLTTSATYVVILLTTEPLLWIWSFLGSAARQPWSLWLLAPPPIAGPKSGRVADSEERVVIVFILWFVLRTVYLAARARIEQWCARQKCEDRLRHALSRPFRADLESGFAAAAAQAAKATDAEGLLGARLKGSCAPLGSAVTCSQASTEAPVGAASEAASSTAGSVLAAPGKTLDFTGLGGVADASSAGGLLEEKRDALVAARRNELCEDVGGEAALPTTLRVKVRRSHLLEDTWCEMVERPLSELLAPTIIVEYDGEEGIDTGGLTRDWFDSVGRAAMESATEPSLLVPAPDGTLMPRPVASPGGEEQVDGMRPLLAFGRFAALAVLSGRPLPLSLGLVVCKYLLKWPVAMDDVRRLDPEFFRGRVEAVLRPGGPAKLADVLGGPLNFVAASSGWRPEAGAPDDACELLPGGAGMEVTEENKVEYVRLLCEAYLVGDVRREIQCMLQGFWDVLPVELLQAFGVGPAELSVLISGIHDVDPEEWCVCSGGATRDPVHQWFWEAVREDLSAEERCLLLHFVTGSSRLPPGGFKELQPAFSVDIATGKAAPDRLPHAHTCINKLVLERYESPAQLREKLRLALSAEGFAFA